MHFVDLLNSFEKIVTSFSAITIAYVAYGASKDWRKDKKADLAVEAVVEINGLYLHIKRRG